MDAFEVLKTRRSVRSFKDQPIPKDIIEKIADAGRFAATARNVQAWEFVAVTARDILVKLGELAENGGFIAGAAACIAVFSSETKYYLEDGCAATQNIMLAARAEGIGSCWVAGDKKPYCADVAKLLDAPPSYKLVSLIPLGYPESKDAFFAASKKDLKDMLHWEKF